MQNKQTILMIEDDVFLAEIFKKRLEKVGYQVVLADNGEKGLSLAKKDKPDLILLDMILPKMNGFEVLKKLKRNKKYENIPVVVLTNLSSKQDIKKAFELGATEYLIKFHVTPKEIIEKIKELLKK